MGFGRSMADHVALNARGFPERTAVTIVGGESYSYEALWERVIEIVEGIGDLERPPSGVKTVGVLMPNSVDALAAFLAAQVVGAAAVPVSHRFAAPEVKYVLEDSQATVLVTGGEHSELARRVSEELGTRCVDCDQIPRGTNGSGNGKALGWDLTGIEAQAPAYVQYTSGTTGFPKGVIYSNERLLGMMGVAGWHFGVTREDRMLTVAPMFHLSGAGLSLLILTIGGEVRVMQRFEPDRAAEELDKHATWVFLVPTMISMLLETAEHNGLKNLCSLRYLLTSGAPITPNVLERVALLFPNAQVAECYGWSEAGFATLEVKEMGSLRPHCVGWPFLGAELQILDENGAALGVGEAGEIAGKTVYPFEGYLNNPDASAKIISGDYVLSGDVGIRDEDGRIRIVDRKVDMIITGGENVYSAEVERVLLDHSDVEDVAVVGLSDEVWGEAVTAVVISEDGAMNRDALETYCKEVLANYKRPRKYFGLRQAEVPRNALGKIQKGKLRELLMSKESDE